MKYKEYREILEFELYRGENLSLIKKMNIKYFRPNTNCAYLARKMWYFYSKGGIYTLLSKLLYLRIMHRYGCSIACEAEVGRGFAIGHPVGICITNATIGENFTILQNCTVGVKDIFNPGWGRPKIGNNVTMCANSSILGAVYIADNVVIGAHSLVVKDIIEPGTYLGSPAKKKL